MTIVPRITPSRSSGSGTPARRRLRADDRGAAIAEFGLVAIPFFSLMLAVLMTSLVFFAQQGVETATEGAARIILTGEAQSAKMTKTQFRDKACTLLPAYMKCANLLVNVQKAASFGAADTSFPAITLDSTGKPNDTFAFDLGAGGDIMIVRLMYVWPLPSVVLGVNLGNLPGGRRLLIGTAVAKTELYQ